MRAVGLLVGALVLASWTAETGVVAEQRTAIRSPGFDENDPRVTAPPVEPTVATPQPTTPPPTVPDERLDEFAVRPESLLLVDGDVPGWQIGSPSPQRSSADPYGDSDCPLLDLVRGVDTYDRIETAGRGAATFYNMVFETGSAAISEGLIDAVRGAPSVCPSFTDDRGMGWLEPLDVPSDGDWDAAGSRSAQAASRF